MNEIQGRANQMIRYNGIPVFVVDDPPPRQIRFPRSKKRRVREEWARRSTNWSTPEATIPTGEVVSTPYGLHMNRHTFVQLKAVEEKP